VDILAVSAIFITLSLFLIIIGIPIAYALGFCTLFGILFGTGGAALTKLGLTPFSVFHGLNWLPLPMFILMAYIISETEIGRDIFSTANKWFSRIPGGLVVSSILAEGAMAATMGVSGTTILTVGTVAIPEMEKLGCNKKFSLGALLSGGVLGPLIPPSIPLIVYGILSQQSIGKLFIAGIIPGILLAIMLSAYTMIVCLRNPELAPRPAAVIWKDRLVSLRKVWPVVALMLGILGGIYLGVVTATEAGGAGVLIILLIAIVFYRFRLANLGRAMSETATLTGMVGLMIIATTVFTFVVGVSGLAQRLSSIIASSGLPPMLVIICINIALLVLGCIMDGLAILMVSMPLFIPIIVNLGFDPVWFGILVTVNIEIALITPPVALNLFLVSGTFRVPVTDIIRGVAPFLAVLVIFLGLLIAFPQISLWLPSMMSRI
jgi:tripartite ATP-independent transporter DctM subunit